MEEGSIERSESGKWQTLKRKLSFRALACCGSLWAGPSHTNHMTLTEDESSRPYSDYSYSQESQQHLVQLPPNSPNPQHSDLHCLTLRQNPAVSATSTEEMNLAAALAAERQFRTAMAAVAGTTTTTTETPTEKISLMRLLEEKERSGGVTRSKESEEEEEGLGLNCCVCMGRKKGAAFIPCGHTFCRVCAGELWLNRGACPLCNRSILEILDIF